MHFSIPDTQELNDGNGSTFIGYNVHINGVFHCTVRYKQLHNLHEQLRREFASDLLPHFPPKKFLPLTAGQIEERRSLLEKYIQTLGQDSRVVSSELLRGFLLSAQQETRCEKKQELKLDVYTMNNCQISLRVLSTDRTEQVLSKACKQLHLPSSYVSYFALFLVHREDNGDVTILRKLQDFESPYISHKSIQESNKIIQYPIVLKRPDSEHLLWRNSVNAKVLVYLWHNCACVELQPPYFQQSFDYWDNAYDLEVMNDPVALNLLYVQTVSDIERGWIFCSKEIKTELAHLQVRLAKKDYIDLARTLKYYGFIQFNPCFCDYPAPQTRVIVAIGSHELNVRIMGPGPLYKEGSFKVTRMRCWRITATHSKKDCAENSQSGGRSNLELSFEYLMSKEKLQWISLMSDQAILMSVCLQSMVDELLVKKNGIKIKEPIANKGNWTYMKRDGSSHFISLDEPDVYPDNLNDDAQSTKIQDSFSIKKLQEKFSSVSFKNGKEFVENHAFEGINDDDL